MSTVYQLCLKENTYVCFSALFEKKNTYVKCFCHIYSLSYKHMLLVKKKKKFKDDQVE